MGASAPPPPPVDNKPDIRPLERIVIYIDDLDRCRPDHVVQMLEATHLLLALDLFVVVVAVDSRWLTRALQIHYKELLSAGEQDSVGLRLPMRWARWIGTNSRATSSTSPVPRRSPKK